VQRCRLDGRHRHSASRRRRENRRVGRHERRDEDYRSVGSLIARTLDMRVDEEMDEKFKQKKLSP